jgi:hypothetical protein
LHSPKTTSCRSRSAGTGQQAHSRLPNAGPRGRAPVMTPSSHRDAHYAIIAAGRDKQPRVLLGMNSIHCTQCGTPIAESDEYCRSCGYQLARTKEIYYPVSIIKFSILSFATFDLYLLYWFYKNWKYVKTRGRHNISPFWRTFFLNLWCYALLSDIDSEIQRKQENPEQNSIKTTLNVSLAIVFFFLVSISWRLPDPYLLMSFLSFTPLLFAVNDINALNGRKSYHYHRNSRFTFRHYALILIGLPIAGFTIASSTGVIPPTTVVAGADLSTRQVRMIREFAELEQYERIDFFYSNALFLRDDGNIITDKRVVSYHTDETGTKYVAAAYFEQILSLHVRLGTFFEDTFIMACMSDNEYLILFAGAQEKADRRFVDTIKARLPLSARFILEEGENFVCDVPSGA